MRWHPFQLNPQASEEGIAKLDFYNSKFGEERTKQMIPFMTVRHSARFASPWLEAAGLSWKQPELTCTCAVQEVFHAEGIQNSFTGKTGNTFNSHRLIALAGRQGPLVQDKLVNALFKAYFEQVSSCCLLELLLCCAVPDAEISVQGKFLNDPKVLLEAAQIAGVDDAEKVVADPDAGREQVRCLRTCVCLAYSAEH